MGFGVTELLIILAIVLVLFGAKKLRNIGGDLGGAIKNFKGAMNEDDDDKPISEKKLSDSIDKGSIENNTSDATFDTTTDTTTENKTKETV
jgi:sec-independent protein translocase protein TatA